MAGKRTLIVPKSRRSEHIEETRAETKSYLEDLPRVISRIGKVDETEILSFRSERQLNSESNGAHAARTEQTTLSEISEDQTQESCIVKEGSDSVRLKSTNQVRSTLGRVKHHLGMISAEFASSTSNDDRTWTYHRVIATSVASILLVVTVGIVLQMKFRADRRSAMTAVVNGKATTVTSGDPASIKLANVKPKRPLTQEDSAQLSKVASSKSETSVKTGSPPKIYSGNVFIPTTDPTPVASLPPLPSYLQSNPPTHTTPQVGNYPPAGYSHASATQPAQFQSAKISSVPVQYSGQVPAMRGDNPNVMQQLNPYASQIPHMALQLPAPQDMPSGATMPITSNPNGYGSQPTENQLQNGNLFRHGSPVVIAQQQNVRAIPTGNQPQPGTSGGPVTYAPNGDVRLDGGIESIPIRR